MTSPNSENVGRAITLTLISIAVFGVQDAVSKVLMQDYSPFQVAMMRYWAFAVFSLVLVLRKGPLREAFRSKAPIFQVARGVLLVLDIWLFAMALGSVPLAELQAISLVYPLLVTLFAIPILGEKVGVFRLGAVAVGFIGALIIVRPGGLAIDAGVLFGIAAAVTYSIYIVMTRRVATRDSTATNMLYVGTIGLVMTTSVGVFHWQPMDLQALGLMAVVMATTCIGHGLMMQALSMAPASVIQPFNYFSLPWAIVLSVVVFSHMIDPISLLGAGIIVAAGLVVMARERRKGVAAVPEATRPGIE